MLAQAPDAEESGKPFTCLLVTQSPAKWRSQVDGVG